jgi:16S rRNA (cytidine1402-2'-O)-methyltransferase
MRPGTLYIVSGPVGNLEDITLRALQTLKDVDLILSEDTRETDKLLKHYKIDKPQISYRDQNHDRVFPKIWEILQEGRSLALISDSGTPLVSDPGFKLVRELRKRDVTVTAIPGPSAAVTALSISGLPTDRFIFLGFLPKSSGKRSDLLTTYGNLDSTLVIYESPHRVIKLLTEIQQNLGNRVVCVAKDLTKMYESVTTGRVEDMLQNTGVFKEKGEYVVLVSKEDKNHER